MSLNTELNEDSKFTQKVEHNSDICSNCYRRLRYQLVPHRTLPGSVSNKLEYTDNAYFDHFDDEGDTGRPSVKKSYCECGFVDKDGKIRPLDGRELMQVASRVNERLDEEDVPHDEDVFFETVREHKDSPSMQFNEEKVLEMATDNAVVTED